MDYRRSAFVFVGLGLGLVLAPGSAFAQAKPAAKTHLNGKPSSMITLQGSANAGETTTFSEIRPDGSVAPFTLPPGSVLVVNDIQCNTSPGNVGILLLQLQVGITNFYLCRFDTGTFGIQRDVSLTNGIVFSVAPSLNNNSTNGLNGFMTLYGYLAKDK